jgi:YebC/PmpR family DNA-binding regulatory protein
VSGHSKWSTIKRKKGAADAKRGQLFTRLGREITHAAREGGGDPEGNFKLRLAVDKARASNMPKDNIERAILRGTGGLGGDALEAVMYEGYGPHSVAILIDTLTDNRNRTVADLRRSINRAGGALAEAGAVGWQFQRKGYLSVNADGQDGDAIFEMAVENGADDVVTHGDEIEIFTPIETFQAVRERLAKAGVPVEEAELTMVPSNTMELEPKDTLQVMAFIEQLEELDDVGKVYSNLHVSEEALRQYEAETA